MAGKIGELKWKGYGKDKPYGFPQDLFVWQNKELEEYRRFVVDSLKAGISHDENAPDWAKYRCTGEMEKELARFKRVFDGLLEKRQKMFSDLDGHLTELSSIYAERVRHEAAIDVQAHLEDYSTPAIPYVKHQLWRVFEALGRIEGPPEVHSDCVFRMSRPHDWLRKLTSSRKDERPHDGTPFLSGLDESSVGEWSTINSQVLAWFDRWMRFEIVNKTNVNKIRLVTPERTVTFPNNRASRALLARARRLYKRLVLLAVGRSLKVVLSAPGYSDQIEAPFLRQRLGLPVECGKAVVSDARENCVQGVVCPAHGAIGLNEWQHILLKSVPGVLRSLGGVPGFADVLEKSCCGVHLDSPVERLDVPHPAADDGLVPTEREEEYLEAFERDGQTWWRVWTYDVVRDYPIAEFSSKVSALRFFRANGKAGNLYLRLSAG